MPPAIKQFLYTVSVLLSAALLALVIMGLFMKETRYTVIVHARASVADLWNTFHDLDQRHIWQPDLKKIEAVDRRSIEPCASFLMHFSDGTFRTETVTSVIPAEKYSATIETGRYSGYHSVTFQELNDGSRIQHTTVMRGSSFFHRAILPVLRPFMQHYETVTFDRLASLTETSSVSPQADG